MKTRVIIPPRPPSASVAVTATPDSGSPCASVTRPLTAMPLGITSTTPVLRSPEERRSVSLFTVGSPFFMARSAISRSCSTRMLKRPSGPLTAPNSFMTRIPPMNGASGLCGEIDAATTGFFDSSTTTPLTRAACRSERSFDAV
jgi:hypothetical protein